MPAEVEPCVNPLIWAAIEQKHLLRFRYKIASVSWNSTITEFTTASSSSLDIRLAAQVAKNCRTGGRPSRTSSLIFRCWTEPFQADAPQNRASITNGTSCSSELNRLTKAANKPLSSDTTQACRKLTDQLDALGQMRASRHRQGMLPQSPERSLYKAGHLQ
jgi:hypothetical protein